MVYRLRHSAILLLISLSIQMSYGQNTYVDRNFGVDGTVTLENSPLDLYFTQGLDSLDNMYITHYRLDTIDYIYKFNLIKLDKSGQIIDNKIPNELKENNASFLIRNNRMVSLIYLAGSSIVKIFDLDYNYIGQMISPGYTTPTPLENGQAEGLTNNIYYRYNPDGFLDKTFSEDGLFDVIKDSGLGENSTITNWLRDEGKSIIFTGYTQSSVDSLYYPFTLKLKENGSPDRNYGNESIKIHEINMNNHSFAYATLVHKLQDNNLLLSGLHYDTLSNLNNYIAKIDQDGELIQNFGDNGVRSTLPTEGDSTNSNHTNVYVGELSNGSLLMKTTAYNEEERTLEEYFVLYNENGYQESNFGTNSKLETTAFKGEIFQSQVLANDNLYIIKTDSVYNPSPYSTLNASTNATHITKLSTSQLLAYDPLSAPDFSTYLLYPNPTSSTSIIRYNGPTLENISYRIHNLKGQLVKEKVIPILYNYSEIPIDMKDTDNGIYYLQIHDEGKEIWSDKIIKIN